MAITTIKITDKGFRVTIPEDVRLAERLQVGDIIQMEVTRLDEKKKPVRV